MKQAAGVLFLLMSGCAIDRQLAQREGEVFAAAAAALELPTSVYVEAVDVTEPYRVWIDDQATAESVPSSIDVNVWQELRSAYAAVNRVSVQIPRGVVRNHVQPNASRLMVAFSRPAFSADGSFALLTYSTAWHGHGTVAAVVLRRTKAGWQHLETIPLIGA